MGRYPHTQSEAITQQRFVPLSPVGAHALIMLSCARQRSAQGESAELACYATGISRTSWDALPFDCGLKDFRELFVI
jgi:hypothetical protein